MHVVRFIDGDMHRLTIEQADAELTRWATDYPAWHQRWRFAGRWVTVAVIGNTSGAVYATYAMPV